MNRRQLIFIIIINALVSLLVALLVVWVVDLRRPDPEELAAILTPVAQANLAITAVPNANASAPDANAPTPTAIPLATTAATATTALSVGASDQYVVQSGDTLLSIAAQFGVSVDAIMDLNNLDNPDFVFVGQRLAVPTGGNQSVALAQNNSTTVPTPTPLPGEGLQLGAIEGAGNLADEVISVVNESNIPYNLRGWTVGIADGPSYAFGELPIFPGASVRLHSTAGNDTSVELYWGRSEAVWTTGETAQLINAEGEVVDTLTIP
jgi:LysM repeat protein